MFKSKIQIINKVYNKKDYPKIYLDSLFLSLLLKFYIRIKVLYLFNISTKELILKKISFSLHILIILNFYPSIHLNGCYLYKNQFTQCFCPYLSKILKK